MSTGHFCHWPKYYYNLLGGPTIQGKRRNSWRSFPCFLGVDPDCTNGLPWFLLIPEQDMFRLVSLLKRHIWHMTTKPKSRSEAKKKENERLRATFTPNSKREFVPRDQDFSFIVVYCLLLLLKNKQFHASFTHKNCSEQFLSAYFLFWEILILNLKFAVCRKRDS